MSLQKIVANNIRALRMERRMTQKSLAKKAKVTEKYVSLIETNARNISIQQLEKISKALEVSVSVLVLDDKNPKKKQAEIDMKFGKLSQDAGVIEITIQRLKQQIEACHAAAIENLD